MIVDINLINLCIFSLPYSYYKFYCFYPTWSKIIDNSL
nr:MAG TPA: hypothetical protein [Caudoviricetes sp.]